MKFKLEFDIPEQKNKISIRRPLVLWGSCFAEHIAAKLSEQKFRIVSNPNGIVFHPLSIFKSMEDCLENARVDETKLFFDRELWHSWEHHGRFSSTSKDELMDKIVEERNAAHHCLQDGEWIIITLGSAWVYEEKELELAVTNCHKVHQQKFEKRLLSVDEIVKSFDLLMKHKSLQQKKILFTVSPVRYVRDGLIGNNRSKAVLIESLRLIMERYAQTYYFPSYEIVLDELRDYRFYEADLVHPNKLAIDYVYEKFASTNFDDETKNISAKLGEVVEASKHRVFNESTEHHKKFMKTFLQKAENLKKEFPFLNLEKELNYFANLR